MFFKFVFKFMNSFFGMNEEIFCYFDVFSFFIFFVEFYFYEVFFSFVFIYVVFYIYFFSKFVGEVFKGWVVVGLVVRMVYKEV